MPRQPTQLHVEQPALLHGNNARVQNCQGADSNRLSVSSFPTVVVWQLDACAAVEAMLLDMQTDTEAHTNIYRPCAECDVVQLLTICYLLTCISRFETR